MMMFPSTQAPDAFEALLWARRLYGAHDQDMRDALLVGSERLKGDRTLKL